MSRPTKEVFERLGTRGLSRVLDDLLDQNRLVRLANTCGLEYPGMRTRSQKRQRIISDLVKRTSQQQATRTAVYRVLKKETRAIANNWISMSGSSIVPLGQRTIHTAPNTSDHSSMADS